jgi:hypothetical protein
MRPMTIHTCMGCGLKTRYSYGLACMSCGLKTRYTYGDWPDRRAKAAVAFAAPSRILALSERHPTATLALTVPSAFIGIAAVAVYPLVFVPVMILLGAALVASTRYEEARTPRRNSPVRGHPNLRPRASERTDRTGTAYSSASRFCSHQGSVSPSVVRHRTGRR